MIVHADGIHAAGGLTRAFEVDDGMIRAGLGAFPAFDAFVGVNVAFSIEEVDRILRADLMARGGQTVLTKTGHAVLLGRAAVAGVGDDIDERRLIVLLGDRCLIHTLRQQGPLLDRLQRKAHGETDAFARDRAFQKDGLSMQRVFAGDDHIGQIFGLGVVAALIGHAGDLCKDALADIRNKRRNPSHQHSLRKNSSN